MRGYHDSIRPSCFPIDLCYATLVGTLLGSQRSIDGRSMAALSAVTGYPSLKHRHKILRYRGGVVYKLRVSLARAIQGALRKRRPGSPRKVSRDLETARHQAGPVLGSSADVLPRVIPGRVSRRGGMPDPGADGDPLRRDTPEPDPLPSPAAPGPRHPETGSTASPLLEERGGARGLGKLAD
jgi:hypothetical protein